MWHGSPPVDPLEQSLDALRTRLILSRREPLAQNWDHKEYCSPFWRLYANNRTGAEIRTASDTLALPARRIVMIPPWLAFETRIPSASAPIWQCYLHFECPGLPIGLQRMIFRDPLFPVRSQALDGLAERWQSGLSSPSDPLAEWSWAQALAQAAFSQAFEGLRPQERRECFLRLRRSGKLGAVLDHIDRHLGQPLRNADLAAICHCSEDHFVRLFRRGLGVTPAQYIIDRRITAAAEWLAQTERTLDDIAADSGFVDRFHLSRCFKRKIGLPPAAYRRIHRSG
jgi:AraC-like DNA-binding protein